RAGGDPVERDLGGRAPELARDLDDGVDDLPVALVRQLLEGRVAAVLHLDQAALADGAGAVAAVLAGQHAAAERAPRAQAEAERQRGGDVLAFDVALDERVLELEA